MFGGPACSGAVVGGVRGGAARGGIPQRLAGAEHASTPAAVQRVLGLAAARKLPSASWADLNVFDRCIARGMPGAMMPGFYNHNYHILQSPGYVVIALEMLHDVRVISLDGRPHIARAVGG